MSWLSVPHAAPFLRSIENQAKAFEVQVTHVQVVRIAAAHRAILESEGAHTKQVAEALAVGVDQTLVTTVADLIGAHR
jgi:hypothetical protein